MFKKLFCPQCGHSLCMLGTGGIVKIACAKCKIEYEISVDAKGCVNSKPIGEISSRQRKK